MKNIIILLAVTALSVNAIDWDHMWVRWSSDGPEDVESFFNYPITADAAAEAEYVEVPSTNKLNLTTYCLEGGHRVCALYQNDGCIAGLQLAELVSDVANVTSYNMSTIPAFSRGTMFGKDVWVSTIYTRDPELLASGGSECDNGLVGEEGIWFEMTDGYLAVPRNQSDLQSVWHAGLCVPKQGDHFFYNITDTSSCEDWFPHFLLYDEGELVGTGFITFGVPTVLHRNWYESYNASLTKTFIPTSPSCLEDWFMHYDAILVHMFFDAEPWNAVCSAE